jgi:hypothetical protein
VIDKYKILIEDINGALVESLTYCDGSDVTIMTQMYCMIPMTVLRSSPFSLTLDTLVQAKIHAHNTRGWSSISDPNTSGVTI